MKRIFNFFQKTIKVKGYEEQTVPMFALWSIISVLLFPIYAMAYAIAYLFKMKDRENMETFFEWFEPIICLIKGDAIIK